MTRELQSTLDASGILWPGMRNHKPCMAHVIQLALGAFMSSRGVKGCTISWEALECDQQFGENESTDIGTNQRLRKEGNARINTMSAMQLSLAKIIEKVRISRHCEWPETNIHIAENAYCINYAHTWLSKRVHWLSKSQSPDCSTTHYGCEDTMELNTGVAQARLPITWNHTWVAYKPKLQPLPATLHNTGWVAYCEVCDGRFMAIPVLGPMEVETSYRDSASLSTMTCLITWMASCELWPRRRHNGRKTYTSPWRLPGWSCPNIRPKSLPRLVCFWFQCISLILSGSCDHLGSGTRQWIWILRMRHLILPNTRRPFWSMWRTNTVPNIDECPSLNPKVLSTATSSPLQRLLDLVNHLLTHIICPAMMTNT